MTTDHGATSVRQALEAVRAHGLTGRCGPVSVRFDPDRSSHLFAFAIGRRVGSAVVRNRVRRRMRAIVAGERHQIPVGTYLVSARPDVTELTFEEMRNAMIAAIERATAPGGAARPAGAALKAATS